MNKLDSFKFYPGDWFKDPGLRVCTKASKGMWIDMLCLMFECDERGFLITAGTPWSDLEIAGAVGGDIQGNILLIQELLKLDIAKRDKRGAIFCARMVRDEASRRSNVKRQKKFRKSFNDETSNASNNDEVTPLSHEEKPPEGPPAALFDNKLHINSDFEAWYQEYPRKVAKGHALKAFKSAIKKVDLAALLAATRRYRASCDGVEPQYIAHPATWLNAERWLDVEDEPAEPKSDDPGSAWKPTKFGEDLANEEREAAFRRRWETDAEFRKENPIPQEVLDDLKRRIGWVPNIKNGP